MIGEWDTLAHLLRGRRVGRGREGIGLDGECWVFLGAKDADGYGLINRGEFQGRTHRYVWLKLIGPVPDGLQVLHYCDNPACVRPAHLWLGTQAQNIQDMFAKGRGNIEGLDRGTEVSRHLRMTKWTQEQRTESARHAAEAKHAGRTLRGARK